MAGAACALPDVEVAWNWPAPVEQGGRGSETVRRRPFPGSAFIARCARQGSKNPPRYPRDSTYVQVNIGEEEQKGGCGIEDVGELVDAVRASPLPLAAAPMWSRRHISRCSPSLRGGMTSRASASEMSAISRQRSCSALPRYASEPRCSRIELDQPSKWPLRLRLASSR